MAGLSENKVILSLAYSYLFETSGLAHGSNSYDTMTRCFKGLDVAEFVYPILTLQLSHHYMLF